MRTTFQDELNLLETTLQEEGSLVLRALRGALNALEQRDHELALFVERRLEEIEVVLERRPHPKRPVT